MNAGEIIEMTSSSLSYSASASLSHFNFSSLSPFLHPIPINLKNYQNLKIKTHIFSQQKTKAAFDVNSQYSNSQTALQKDEMPNKLSSEVEKCVEVLKDAAKTRKVASDEILHAFSVIEKSKLDPSCFFETLGGTESPGRTWMLIFTSEKSLKGGKYFPITAVQRFDAAGKRIENGVYLGGLGWLTFEGRLSWKKKILAFIFERVKVKVGPFNPFEISLNGEFEREPSNKDPFFIWMYVDEDIAVARGRSGGTAFWVRCQRIMK